MFDLLSGSRPMRISRVKRLLLFLFCCFVIYLTSANDLPVFLQWIPKPAILILWGLALVIQLYSAILDGIPPKTSSHSENIRETPFPFELVDSLDKLHTLLLPPLGSTPLPDYDIPFIDRGLTGLKDELDKNNRVLLLGKSKLGKTRLMAELLSNELKDGGALILKHYQWFYPGFIPPENLRSYKDFVIAVDDLNHYLDFKAPTDAGYVAFSFDEFLVEAVHNIENTCGKDTKIKIIITAKPEQSFWKSLKLEKAPWQSFQIFPIAPMSNRETKELIQKLADRTGIQ